MSIVQLLHRNGENIVINGLKGKKGSWLTVTTTDIAKAERTCQDFAAKGYNVYVKHALHDGKTSVSKTGRTFPDCHENHFTGSRTFFVDVDVGSDKKYATIQDAWIVIKHCLKELRDTAHIPVPNLILQTGGGFHFGWVVADVVPAGEWKRLTDILFLLLRHHKLELDTQVDTIGRNVRVCGPGYLNTKHGAPIETKELLRGNSLLTKDFVAALVKHSLRPVNGEKAPRAAARLSNDEYAPPGGKEFKLNLNEIVLDCKVMEQAIATGGADDNRQEWIKILGIVAKNEDDVDGRMYAKLVSDKHRDYDEDELIGLYENIRADNKGYTKCETFQKTKLHICTTCAWYKTVNSPAGIQGAKAKAAPSAAPVFMRDTDKILNGPYYNTAKGIFCPTAKEDEDAEVWRNARVTELQLLKLDVDMSRDILAFTHSHADGSNPKTIHIETHGWSSDKVLMTRLAGYGIPVPHHQQKPVFNAMVSWLEEVRRIRMNVGVKYTRLGWTSNGASFVLGTNVYHRDGNVEPLPPDETMEQFNPHGDRAEYNQILHTIFANEQRPEAHAFLAAGLGSVLLEICGLTGISLNFFSPQSGHGKTTLARTAASMWGNPQPMMFTLDDTANAMHHKATKLHNLPVMFDELRPDKDGGKSIGSMAFRIASGQEKSRLNRESKLQDQGGWRSFTIFSTNYSFADFAAHKNIGGDAALARIMDFPMPALPMNSRPNAGTIALEIAKLERLNGHIGHDFIKFVVANYDTCKAGISGLFNQLMTKSSGSTTDVSGRNHAAAGACLIMAATIAAKRGLVPLDHRLVSQAVNKAMVSATDRKQTAQSAMDPEAILSEYLKTHEDRRIVTTAGGGAKMTILNRNHLRPPIAYEVNLKTGEMLIDVPPFMIWLGTEGYVPGSVLQGLAKYRTDAVIAAGTEYRSPAKRSVLRVPLTGIFEGDYE